MIGSCAFLFALWIMAGELSGWKPKLIWDKGEWWGAAFTGVLIGGIGAIGVPLSTLIQRKLGEPRIMFLENKKEYKLPFWEHKKQLFNWTGSWNEVYFGMIFSIVLQMILLIKEMYYG